MTEQGHAQFVLYDDFSSGVIDPSMWYGDSTGGNFNAPMTEMLRQIDNGQLHLATTSYGNNQSDTGTVTSRVHLKMKQLGANGGTGFITGIKANITMLDAKIGKCGPNTATGQARGHMSGIFFYDGTPAGTNDRTGSIGAFFNMVKHAPPINGQTFVGGMFRCADASCSTTPTIASTTFTATWVVGETVTAKLLWNKAAGKFTFTVKGETLDLFYPSGLADNGPAVFDTKSLQATNIVENCEGVYKKGISDVLFDNVQVRRQP
jgi:hypothetical protein